LVTLESRHLVARTIGWVASVSIANVATSRRSTAGRLELACIGSGIAPTKLASGGVVIASVKAGLHAAVADQGAGIDATSLFDDIGHSEEAKKQLEGFLIGKLKR